MVETPSIYGFQSYNNPPTHHLRKLVLGCVLIIVVIIAAVLGWDYVHTGYILVTAANYSDTITANTLANSEIKTIDLRPDQRTAVHTGSYIVAVSLHGRTMQQVINVGYRKTTVVNAMLLPSIKPIEPVTSLSVSGLNATTNQLMFLDSNSNNLETINSANQLSVVSNMSLETMQWDDTGFGIGESKTGGLYAYNNGNGAVQKIDLPSSLANNNLNYSLAPNNVVYLANQGNIYSYTLNGNLKKLYSTNTKAPVYIDAGSNLVVVGWVSKNTNYAVVITTNGKLIAKRATDSSGYVLSPNGQFMVSTSESYGEILNTHLKPIAIIPGYNILNPVWLNNDTVIYSLGNQIWSYNVNQQKSVLLTQTKKSIAFVTLNSNRTYLYFSLMGTKNNNSTTTLWRLGLDGQPVSAPALSLAKNLPLLFSVCSYGYINFTSPTIIIQPFLNQVPQSCITDVNVLGQFGVNPSQAKIEVDNITVNSI